MACDTCFHVYVGSEIGLIKGVDVSKKIFYNLNEIQRDQRKQEINCMCWRNEEESEIYLGLSNQTVKLFDTMDYDYSIKLKLDSGSGKIVGIAKYDDNLLTCVESGIINVWNEKNNEKMIEINAGPNLCRMATNPFKSGIIASGGQENDLKIWDLQKSKKPIFHAKNVRDNFLDLRVPVWVLNMKFFPDSEKIVTTTGHHQIRVYDPSSKQRRPVIDMEFDSYPIGALSLTNQEHQILVGNTQGRMALIDLRKKAMVHVYKGFAGSIRDIQFDPVHSQVYSCGLDRFLRIHDLDTHELKTKMYLKSGLNALLCHSEAYNALRSKDKSSTQNTEYVEDTQDSDNEIWDNMEVVSNKKQKISSNKNSKLKRKSKHNASAEFNSKVKKKKKTKDVKSSFEKSCKN
ncbi:WD repeat-containing protein 74-like [Centruroides sculpturatus]|uniref:WD repeat-containing protein 74-like n=1 Tax=Centruroides sculpturatus TaxID=218467 RepID=UPI000C6D7DBE|nr:WD repeat-containing protein 74-like [Centruroides sculpturatus]